MADTPNIMLKSIRDARLDGKSYLEIESLFGVSAAEAEAMMNTYYAKVAKVNPNEYRILQLERLESLIGPLRQMIMMGNTKSAGDLSKILEQISTLLGLNLQTEKIEIKILQDNQVELIMGIIAFIMRAQLAMIQGIMGKSTDEEVINALGQVEDAWDMQISISFNRVMSEIVPQAVIEAK